MALIVGSPRYAPKTALLLKRCWTHLGEPTISKSLFGPSTASNKPAESTTA